MPLSWNEIRDRALAFSREWKDATSEQAEAQSFWNDFFKVFGIERRRVAIFEKQVEISRVGKKLKTGRIDAFWKGVLLIESKSAGVDLDRAFAQAADYFEGLPERDLPRYILVSDFKHFRLFDLEPGQEWQFPLPDFHKNIKRFGFIAGYRTQEVREQDPVNVEAAERMGRLHDLLKASGYVGHELEMLLVRLLFCLFADDTAIFSPKGIFRDLVETTREDGVDLGPQLALLFEILDTPIERRQKSHAEAFEGFPYVNGRLFEERLRLAGFDAKMRATLLDCAALDWSGVSPAIFGAMFQSVMHKEARRNLGAHYTSEKNILKLIKPLFLDDLWDEFNRVKGNINRLFEFHKKLRVLTFLDPACGCGNFLVIAYRELRLLELEVLKAAHHSKYVDVFHLVQVNVDQFHGIEIEEFPAQIAQVALWLVDHQMNQLVSEEFGQYYVRLPLKTSPHVICGNALRFDWNDVIPAERVSYILGNPPFVGKQYQSEEQKADLDPVWSGIKGAGVLDYVAGWYLKAVRYVRGDAAGSDLFSEMPETSLPPRDRVKIAFVSTNSITQGEQVSVLWSELLRLGVKIHFAHRTFQWSNEARGVAAVHCVIIGFALFNTDRKAIFEYADIKGDAHPVSAKNINPYVVDAPDVVLEARRTPICRVPEIAFGSMPNDAGHLLLDDHEKQHLLERVPGASKWVRPFLGAEEFINRGSRWCLWLKGITPQELRAFPEISKRVALVKKHCEESKRGTTMELAKFPTLFGEIRQPETRYLAIPKTSSERRLYVPMALLDCTVIASTELFTIANAGPYHFGVLTSAMHAAWVRYVCGRLKSDYRYSAGIVYNNFPWPRDPSEKQVKVIEEMAQGVLDTRETFSESSLADLYDPLTMPPLLTKAHQQLDRAVDAAYGKRDFKSDADRVAFLFELYQQYTSLLPAEGKKAKRPRSRVKI